MRQLAKACDYENADWIGWQIETYLNGVVDMAAVCGSVSEPLWRQAEAWTASCPQDSLFDAFREMLGWQKMKAGGGFGRRPKKFFTPLHTPLTMNYIGRCPIRFRAATAGSKMEWVPIINAIGVIVAIVGTLGTAGFFAIRFIVRLDDKIDRFGENLETLARTVSNIVERTARLEGRVDELSRKGGGDES